MPHYYVRQPDGRFAIFSSIVGMSDIYSAQDPLEWCFECDRWGKTCKGTDHPVFCPKIDHDEPEFMENEVRE